jgi:hypothetical protein
MSTQMQLMSDAMFPAQGMSVVNVKFFLGDSRRVTDEQLADQLDRADAQIRSGAAGRTRTLDGDLTVMTF